MFGVGVDKVVVAVRWWGRQLSVSSIAIIARLLVGEPDRIVVLSSCVCWPQLVVVILMLLMLLLMILVVLIIVLILVDMFTTV